MTRKENLENHVRKCPPPAENLGVLVGDGVVTEQCDASGSVSEEPPQDISQRSVLKRSTLKKPCQICGRLVSSGWLKKHLNTHKSGSKDINLERHHHSVLIDASNGIYSSAVCLRGLATPIHVQKKTSGVENESVCEHKSCIDAKATAQRGGHMAFECDHLRSIPYARPGRTVDMQTQSLQRMRDDGLITQTRYESLLSHRAKAETKRCPLVVYLPPDDLSSSRYMYLSVFTGAVRYWSRLERTVVTYDTDQNNLMCKCSINKRYCVHKAVGKWYIFQEMPHLYSTSTEEPGSDEEETTALPESPAEKESAGVSYPCDKRSFPQMLNYAKSEKAIPAVVPQVIDTIYSRPDFLPDKEIEPSEVECNHCHGPLCKELVSRRSKILLLQSTIKGKLRPNPLK
jgi:hypothetical protein